MKKVALSILSIITCLFIFTRTTYAADYNVSCGGSSCSPSSISPLYPSSTVWYPGLMMSKTIQITNSGSITQPVSVRAENITTTGNLSQVVQFTITRSDSSVAYNSTLYDFHNAGEVEIFPSLSVGSAETFTFKAEMFTSASNGYQGKSTKFDLVFGLYPVPTLTPGPTGLPYHTDTGSPYHTPSDGGTGGGATTAVAPAGGTVLGLFTYPGTAGEEVLGKATEEGTITPIAQVTSKPSVEGATTGCPCLWWPILLAEIIVLFIYFFFIFKKEGNNKPLAFGTAVPILTYIVFLLLNKCLRTVFFIFVKSDNMFCRYFILLDLLIFIIYLLIWKKRPQKENTQPKETQQV